ncbi:MAG: ROK family protein [Anaerolineales bacterium]|nr:ROK family protein [Chloroflexota bacterium]MBL6983102.1 ROK family protein [Anaerolineales bacterium]
MLTQHFSGRNLNRVKAHNLQAILMSLLHENQISRAGLAKRTSLSSATVTNLANELLAQGIITEIKPQATEIERKRAVGRPRRMLRLVPNARYALGVHIGVGLFRIALTNLHADIIDNRIVEFERATPAAEVLEKIALEIEDLLLEMAIDRSRILGIGVGASGLVNHDQGINVIAPRLGWNNIYIQAELQARLGFPVRVDNNVRAMAIAEAFFGAGRGAGVLAFVYGRIGVGAGFVVNGQVFRGSGAGAGEIGHTIVVPQGGQECRCGQNGCLETLVTEPVIIRRSVELAQQHPESLLAKYMENESAAAPSIETVFAAARDGDELTLKMLDDQICYLGIALANLVNVLNPGMILLGGVFAQGDDLVRPIASKVMRETAFSGLGDDVIIEPTSFGWRAGVVGAAALALMDFFYQTTETV